MGMSMYSISNYYDNIAIIITVKHKDYFNPRWVISVAKALAAWE